MFASKYIFFFFRSLCTAPPPAIACTVVLATKDDLQRYGRVTQQVYTTSKKNIYIYT